MVSALVFVTQFVYFGNTYFDLSRLAALCLSTDACLSLSWSQSVLKREQTWLVGRWCALQCIFIICLLIFLEFKSPSWWVGMSSLSLYASLQSSFNVFLKFLLLQEISLSRSPRLGHLRINIAQYATIYLHVIPYILPQLNLSSQLEKKFQIGIPAAFAFFNLLYWPLVSSLWVSLS